MNYRVNCALLVIRLTIAARLVLSIYAISTTTSSTNNGRSKSSWNMILKELIKDISKPTNNRLKTEDNFRVLVRNKRSSFSIQVGGVDVDVDFVTLSNGTTLAKLSLSGIHDASFVDDVKNYVRIQWLALGNFSPLIFQVTLTPAIQTTASSKRNELTVIFNPSSSEIASQHSCVTSSISVQLTKSSIRIGYLYKLQVKDMQSQKIQETSVKIILTEEANIQTTHPTSSSKTCGISKKLSVSANNNVLIEITAGRLKNKIKTISRLIYQVGSKSYKMTFVDFD